jgi:hypothetical protein
MAKATGWFTNTRAKRFLESTTIKDRLTLEHTAFFNDLTIRLISHLPVVKGHPPQPKGNIQFFIRQKILFSKNIVKNI